MKTIFHYLFGTFGWCLALVAAFSIRCSLFAPEIMEQIVHHVF